MGPGRPRPPERATESQEYPNELVEDRNNRGGLRGQWRPAWPVKAQPGPVGAREACGGRAMPTMAELASEGLSGPEEVGGPVEA